MEQSSTNKTKRDKLFYVARIATILSILMYVSYLPQIGNNVSGVKGNPIQPLCAAINSTFWVAYGLMKTRKDWPVVIANLPGIVLGFIAFITAL